MGVLLYFEEKTLKRTIDMLNGSIADKILVFALPLAVTGILQQLFNAADVAVVGRFVGKTAMAAVGSNTSLIALILNIFIGVSLGANVVIAMLTGQNHKEKISRAVHTAIVVAVISGLIATVVGEIVAVPVLRLMSVPDEVFDMAVLYLRIYLLGMPVILLYNFESAIFRSQGDTRTPLFCLILSGVINVLLNLFFVIVCGMAAEGVALATIIANLISAALLFYILCKREGPVQIHINKLRIDGALLKRMLKIGLPAGIQGMLFSFSNVLIQSAINALGEDVMAASSAAFNVEIFVYYLVNSFGQAATTFVGQNYGAGNIARCRKVTAICTGMDMAITAVVSLTMLYFATPLLQIFNSDPAILSYGIIRLRYILSAEVITVIMEVFSGCMRGYGYSTVPAVICFVGVCGLRIAWVYTAFNISPTYHTLMMVYPISWGITSAALLIAYFLMRPKAVEKA